MTSPAQMLSVRGKSHSENMTQLCCVNKCKTKKSVRRRTKKNQQHRNISPLSLQFCSHNSRQNAGIAAKEMTCVPIIEIETGTDLN